MEALPVVPFFFLLFAAPILLLLSGGVYAWRRATGADTGSSGSVAGRSAAAFAGLLACLLLWEPFGLAVPALISVLFVVYLAVRGGQAAGSVLRGGLTSSREGPVGSIQRIGAVIGVVLILMLLAVVVIAARSCG